ncbi:MAG: hypothetical protein ACYSW4_07160 [Planctomycetota bacterium]|jgi:hypothetical protein
MKNLAKVLLLVGLCVSVKLALAADPGDDAATCNISVTVNTIMEWAGNFTDITLTAISSQTDTPSDSEAQTIYANCNFEIGADNTATAQLSSATDTLTTEYDLADDGDGSATTGAGAAAEAASGLGSYTDYTTFLSTELAITHVDGDGAVGITLSVQASCPSGEVPDAGSYSATQTLTASWTSD